MRLRPFILCFNRTAISIQKIDSKSSKSHLKSLPRISPKSYRHRLYLKPFLIAIFNFSHKRPTFALTPESGYTLAFAQRIAHNGSHGETGGRFGWGWYHYSRSVPHVHKHPRAGCQNGKLCRFWVLVGGALEERREPAGQRCAYACRCPEASRPRWAA